MQTTTSAVNDAAAVTSSAIIAITTVNEESTTRGGSVVAAAHQQEATCCSKVKSFLLISRDTSNLKLNEWKWRNLVSTFYYLIVYLVKVFSELALALEYARLTQWVYFTLTVVFMVYPSIIISTWSLIHMKSTNGHQRRRVPLKKVLSILCHCSLISPVAS